jgi:hypothetical protein
MGDHCLYSRFARIAKEPVARRMKRILFVNDTTDLNATIANAMGGLSGFV